MNMGVNRFLLTLTAALALSFVLGGCQKKGALATCKNDADCRLDANGKEINGVCYMGKCEECAENADCSDLKQCVNNRCVGVCQADADCGSNQHCENTTCVADCTTDESCGGNHVCAQGRCMAKGEESDPNAWAASECRHIDKVLFDFDRYNVKPEFKGNVDQLGMCLEKNPQYSVKIDGHTDDRGTPSYNMALGQKRADSVRSELKAKGIASNRMKTISYGAQNPAMQGQDEHAWQQNRRAEFTLENN